MRNNCHRTLLARLTLAAGLLCCISQASAERWYRVELLAFSQRGGERSESWPATPALAYPEEGRFLMDTSEVLTTVASPSATHLSEGTAQTQGTTAEEQQARAGQHPFVRLPDTRKEFLDTANTMARSGRYKILFHETWIQPVGSKRSAVPLVLDRSGDTTQWPPLQGSITLWLSRYLHLETNLWLNTAGEYLQGQWQMPAPPLGPRAVANSSGDALFAQDVPVSKPETATEPASAATASAKFYWEQNEANEPAANAYPYRHAVALKQKRRMRSKEVHYIDHPMLGLMIELTPLETAEDALAGVSGSQQLLD